MKTAAFNKFASEYDSWFDTYTFAYQSVLSALARQGRDRSAIKQ